MVYSNSTKYVIPNKSHHKQASCMGKQNIESAKGQKAVKISGGLLVIKGH